NGIRCSTAAGYLKPARRRPNLHVETHAHATRILFDGRTATGVEFMQHGRLRRADAAGEMILCGGAINSPQLLELSGVGNGELLQSLGIPVVHDAPMVGENLQDHLQVRMVMRAKQRGTWNEETASLSGRIRMALRYALLRKGPLAVSAGYAAAFFKTREELAVPDIQVHFLLFSTDKMGEKLHSFPGFTASVCQLRPESRGSIHVESADPFRPPSIRANYLTAQLDRDTKVAGLKTLREILHAPALRPFVAEEVHPGPDVTSDGDLLAFCRQVASTVYHPTSTCAMGPEPDAVVTPELKVNGIGNLRVVDASVMPRLISGNTNAPVIMIAEKASDMILADAP
ncbi:MAG TPA: GMC oxidoreductase, partial [Afifellaceae bacterium]|nr:GMC oxidoreductase [Afifellaceae bacterium]